MTHKLNWYLLYAKDNKPLLKDISCYISNSLWEEINAYIQNTYDSQPVLSYSKCSAQRGWNIKYKKGQKALCTLYPMDGYFIALVVISSKEETAAETLLPGFCDYVRQLYQNTKNMPNMGRWLMISVTDPVILRDVKLLMELKVKPRNKD